MKKNLTIFILCFCAKILFAQDVIAHFELNGNGEDIGSNNYTATVYGAIPTTDRFGNEDEALYFDGVDDFLEIMNQDELNFGVCDFAISFWMKTSSSSIQMIVHNGESGTTPQYWVRLKDYSSSEIDLKFITSNGIPTSPFVTYNDPLIYDDNWHHVVVQRVNYYHEIYFDGELVSSSENSEIKDIMNDDSVLIGAQHPHPSNGFPEIHNYFQGALDDMIFFKGRLSEEQVVDLYEEVVSINFQHKTEWKIKLFPNPSYGIITLENLENNDGSIQINIFDSNGRNLKSFRMIQNTIDISDLKPGIYFIQMISNQIQQIGKILLLE